MPIGVLELELYMPQCKSLKEKRVILKGLKDRVHRRFNVSIAEVDSQDLWQRSKVMVAVVSSTTAGANSLLSRVINFIESEKKVTILDLSLTFY